MIDNTETPTVESALLSMLKEDGKVVLYRPRLSRMIGTTSAILLQQMYYRYDGHPFYKLKSPCSSHLYKVGDSWCEELGFHSGEFDTALRRISTKCTKGKSKTDLLATCPDIPSPIATETKNQYMKRLGEALQYLIIFWTDSNRVTWYSLNIDLFAKLLIAIYIEKLDCAIHGVNGESQFIFIIEPKKTNIEKDSQQQNAAAQSDTDLEISHEAIALEIRAANDAMRGDDHEIFHDCIEDYIDTDETPATVDFVTYTGEPLSRCYNCKNQFPIGTSIAVITVGNMSTDFCRDCYADGDNHDKMVADLAARPALPVAENDDSFLGTRDDPVTPDGADWARDAVDNADDDIPDSTLCGYRDPEGHKLTCHDCYGEGVCGATGSDGWIHQQIVGKQEECSGCCKQMLPGETIARNEHDVNLCDDCYRKKRSSNADAMQVQRLEAETIARLAVAETLLGESGEGILDTVVGLLQDEQPQPLTDRALELNNSLADRALAYGLAMAGVEVIDNVAYRIGDVPALQVQDEQPHDIAWGKLKDEARLRKEQETPATSTDAIVPALEAQQNTTPTKKPKSLKTAKAKKRKKKEVHPLYQEMVDEIILAFDVKREHLDKQDFGRIGKEANLLLGKDAKPFMVKHLHAWLKKKFNTTFGYNTLSKWYAPFRADSNIPDDIPEKEEPAPPPESDGAEIVQGSKEDIQRILAETTAKMSMSQFGDENYEQSAD